MPCSVCVISGKSATGVKGGFREVFFACEARFAGFKHDTFTVPDAKVEDRLATHTGAAPAPTRDTRGARHRSRAGAAALAGGTTPKTLIASASMIFPRGGLHAVRL